MITAQISKRNAGLTPERRRGERGFTIVEMMVVMFLIAILAAVLYNKFSHPQAQGVSTAGKEALNQIQTALESYHTDCQDYPGGTTGSAPCTGASGDNNVDVTLFGGANNPYLTTTPTLQNQEFTYTYVAATTTTDASYVICTPYIIDSTTVGNMATGTGNGTGTGGVGECYSPSAGYYHT